MDDLGLNKWLENTYGTSIDGRPLFRIIWSTGVTEKRHSKFCDFYGDILIREVIETREVLKYPFAQDRWVLERLIPLDVTVKEDIRSDDNWIYNEVYIYQDKNGNFLPLNQEATEAALYLFFKYFLQMSWKERTDIRMELLAKRELEKKQKIRESLGEGRSPFGFVLE